MAGRKTKLTKDLIKNAERLIKSGNYANVVCEFLGIGESTWYRWLEEGKNAETGLKREFWEAIRSAESEAEIRLVTDLQKIADEKQDPKPIQWMLERKYPSRWGRKDRLQAEIEHSGEVTNREEREVTITQQLTADDESRELLKQLWRRKMEIQQSED